MTEMQKVADAADIYVLFFQLVLIFGPFLGAKFFVAKYASVLFKSLFATLSQNCRKIRAKIVTAICNKTWVRKVNGKTLTFSVREKPTSEKF